MFRKSVSGISVDNLAINRNKDNEQKDLSLLVSSNLADINNQNIDCLVTSSANELLGKGSKNTEGLRQNAFSSSLKVCKNNTSIGSQQHSGVMFSSLMRSPVSKQSAFVQTTIAELLDSRVLFTSPPTSKDFKVILFNDAIKTCQFGFKQELITNIRSGLLSVNAHSSYKYLASIAISIAQNTLAITDLKNKGIVNRSEFNVLNSKLTKYAVDCTEIGNAYYDRLIKKPKIDTFITFLVVEAYKDKQFLNLYKQSSKVDSALKNFIKSRDEIKEVITQNLDYIVNRFIYKHFQLEKSKGPDAKELDLTEYIESNALGQIQALFADDSRNRAGHQFNSGGIEHLYDCFAEMFNHFIIVNKKPVHG